MVDKTEITNETKISEMTVGELKALIHEVVSEIVQIAVFELEQQLPDPDAGKPLKPEFEESLRKIKEEGYKELIPLEQVRRELGLDE